MTPPVFTKEEARRLASCRCLQSRLNGTGVGFLIEHQGNAIDYVVLGWWDRENELPLRTFVCEPPVTGTWRTAHGSESVCVWDLQIIWNERQAYVETVLAEHPVDAVRNYMNRTAGCVEAAGD